jgi:hypothetical protein
MVIPWILKLLGLSVLFYAGIYFNVKYALKTEIPSYVNLLIFVFLIVLIGAQAFIYHIKFGKYKFMFFTNRIEFAGKKPKTFLFSDFQSAELKQGLFDKMFNTGSIRLSKTFDIGPISNVSQIKSYLEQLVQYYRASQQKFRQAEQQVSMAKELAAKPAPAAAPASAQPAPQPSPTTAEETEK